MSANEKQLKAATVDSLASCLLCMSLPKKARFSVKKLVFADTLCKGMGQPEPKGESLENHSSVQGTEQVSVQFNRSVPTSATVTCSIFGQNSINKTGYEPSRKKPI